MDIYEQELRRRKINEALLQNSLQSDPTQVVSGRAVPNSPIQGISKVLQALIAKKGINDSDNRVKEAREEEKKRQSTAMERVIGTMTGGDIPYELSPEEKFDNERIEGLQETVDPNPQKAMMMLATNPDIKGKGMSNVASAMMRAQGAGRSPYHQNVDIVGPDGNPRTMVFNARTGEYTNPALPDVPESPVMQPKNSSVVQGTIAGSRQQAKKDVDLTMNPKITEADTSAEMLAKRKAEKVIELPKMNASMASLENKTALMDSTIEKAKEQAKGFLATSWGSQLTGWIGGTPAKNLGTTLDTIKANIGFDRLQEMRDNSKSGGALGQVSEMENRLLQAVWASVEQSQNEEELIKNLDVANTQFKKSWARVLSAYEEDYGKPYTPSEVKIGETSAKESGHQSNIDALLLKYGNN